MTTGDDRPGTSEVLAQTASWIVPAYALLLLPLVVERLDPAGEPRIDLTGTTALVAWVFAESGQTLGIVGIAAVLLVVLAARPGPSPRARVIEAVVVIVVSVVVLYGGNLFNDHVVKPAIGVARPNIVQLADAGVLGMDVDRFYSLSEEGRSEYLDSITSATGFGELMMRPEVRDHWVKETAFSRPSGHALAAMNFATFYVAVAMWTLSGRWRWPFLLLAPWAACVSLSRPILRVHWPVDILLGGLAGIVLGAGAFVLTRWVVLRFEPARRDEPRSER